MTAVIDYDTQANTSEVLMGGPPPSIGVSDVVAGRVPLHEALHPTRFQNVLCCPSNDRLATTLDSLDCGQEQVLREAIDGLKGVAPPVDVVLIDTASAQVAQWSAIAALAASTHVLIPFDPDSWTLDGIKVVERLRLSVNKRLRGKADILGYLHVRFNKQAVSHQSARASLVEARGKLVFDTAIRQNINFIYQSDRFQSIAEIEAKGRAGERKGTQDYEALAAEVAGRIGLENLVQDPKQVSGGRV